MPPILKLDQIGLTFGGTPLLESADLSVEPGERMALVGRNGSGKSTLLKIAAGFVEPQDGAIFRQPGTIVSYLAQDPDFTSHATVEDAALFGLNHPDDINRALILIDTLGLLRDGNPKSLSGGESRRLAITRALAVDPDILLLDEPTNHLDLPTIEWFEGELARGRAAVITISHDRRFLENVSRKVVWLERGQTRVLNKGFAAFEGWRDTVFEEEELEAHKLARKIVAEEHWVRYGVSARRKRNMRRLGELGQMRQELAERRRPEGTVSITASDASASGKMVIEAKTIAKSYEGRAIVSAFSMRILRGDRIGIAGANGAGKTTLLKMLTGVIEPDSGSVRLGANLTIGTLDQNRDALDPNRTLADYLTDGRGENLVINGEQRHVTAYMKDFLFRPEQARTPISVLSGGEKARLLLARTLAQPVNLLVLDEPTNDLDLETLDLLEDFVANFEGTVILVSHDRDFLDRTVTSLIHAEGGGDFTQYAGGYADMIAQRKADAVKAAPKNESKTAAKPIGSASSKKLSFKQKFQLENLPREIAVLETEIAMLERELSDASLYSRDHARFVKASALLDKARTDKESKEGDWLELEILREDMEG
ncbi:MAG: ABC-F family ATP-binding cassette domain-containing protein [Notoacmeibacter sp.]